jgi:hypothetical protein
MILCQVAEDDVGVDEVVRHLPIHALHDFLGDANLEGLAQLLR